MALKWKKLIRNLRADAKPIVPGEEELTVDYIQYAIAV